MTFLFALLLTACMQDNKDPAVPVVSTLDSDIVDIVDADTSDTATDSADTAVPNLCDQARVRDMQFDLTQDTPQRELELDIWEEGCVYQDRMVMYQAFFWKDVEDVPHCGSVFMFESIAESQQPCADCDWNYAVEVTLLRDERRDGCVAMIGGEPGNWRTAYDWRWLDGQLEYLLDPLGYWQVKYGEYTTEVTDDADYFFIDCAL